MAFYAGMIVSAVDASGGSTVFHPDIETGLGRPRDQGRRLRGFGTIAALAHTYGIRVSRLPDGGGTLTNTLGHLSASDQRRAIVSYLADHQC